MIFKIHGQWPDGTEDSFVVEGETIEEIREMVQPEVEARQWTNCWSEEIDA